MSDSQSYSPLYQSGAYACDACGVMVIDTDTHTAWHASLGKVLMMIAERAIE